MRPRQWPDASWGSAARELTERNIEVLVDLYLDGDDHAAVDRELEQENAELRARYLREVPTYTAADIPRTHARLTVKQPE